MILPSLCPHCEIAMTECIDILLIEDSPSQARYFQLLLARAGYHVQIAVDGTTGWRHAHTCSPRLILLDVDLPIIDGFTLLSRFKHDPATTDIPVVMLTQREHISHVQRAIDLGASDYVFKDDASHQLCSVVQQLLPARMPPPC